MAWSVLWKRRGSRECRACWRWGWRASRPTSATIHLPWSRSTCAARRPRNSGATGRTRRRSSGPLLSPLRFTAIGRDDTGEAMNDHDVHGPTVRELAEKGDWAALVRYWMALQYDPALEAAIAVVRA